MDRELNPPDEILRRLLYIVYLALMTAAFALTIIGLVKAQVFYLGGAICLGWGGYRLRTYGRLKLDFVSLAESFPYDGLEATPSSGLRREVEELLRRSALQDIGWVERQELRKRLTHLLEQDPRLWELFGKEIKDTYPALAARAGHVKQQ